MINEHDVLVDHGAPALGHPFGLLFDVDVEGFHFAVEVGAFEA